MCGGAAAPLSGAPPGTTGDRWWRTGACTSGGGCGAAGGWRVAGCTGCGGGAGVGGRGRGAAAVWTVGGWQWSRRARLCGAAAGPRCWGAASAGTVDWVVVGPQAADPLTARAGAARSDGCDRVSAPDRARSGDRRVVNARCPQARAGRQALCGRWRASVTFAPHWTRQRCVACGGRWWRGAALVFAARVPWGWGTRGGWGW